MSEFKFSLLGTMLVTMDLRGNLCPAGFNRFLHSSWCCFGRGSSVLHFMTRTPGLSMFWFHSSWQQLCSSVETCYSAMLLSPNSSPRLLFCTRPQSPPDLPLALTFQGLLKGFVLSLLINGRTAILSCHLVQTESQHSLAPGSFYCSFQVLLQREPHPAQFCSPLLEVFSQNRVQTFHSHFNLRPSTFLSHFSKLFTISLTP